MSRNIPETMDAAMVAAADNAPDGVVLIREEPAGAASRIEAGVRPGLESRRKADDFFRDELARRAR